MKYIKLFEFFKVNEGQVDMTLYHGGLEGGDEDVKFIRFNKFSSKTAYFTDNPEFAYWYADTKSMDMGLDADRLLYTCQFKGNLFNSKNKNDLDKLIKVMPDEIEVRHGTAWFLSHKFPKEEVIKMLQGIEIIKPIDYIANANIGDYVENPSYKSEKYIVVDKNDDFVYTISERTFNDYLSSSISGYNKHWSNYTVYKEIFEPYRQAIVDWYNKETKSDRKVGKYNDWFSNYSHTYYYAKKGHSIDYVSHRNTNELSVTKEDSEKIDTIYNECFDNFKKIAYKELPRKEWTRKVIEVKNDDYWNFYETEGIADNIKKLGYDGYIASEHFHGKSYNSFAIFRPDETVKIIKIDEM